MKVEFPCPASRNELTPSANGFYCSYCAKEVIDIDEMTTDEVEELVASNSSICVSTKSDRYRDLGTSIRKFALSLLIVFGGSLFSFADAQVEEKMKTIQIQQPGEACLGMMQIVFTDQDGDTLSTSVNVEVRLPNGKILEPELSEIDDTYWVVIPVYAKSKEVIISAERFGKKKSRAVYISGFGEAIVEEISFKVKNRFPYRTIGCPNF